MIVVDAIRGRCASLTVLTATVWEIFGGQTNPAILVVKMAAVSLCRVTPRFRMLYTSVDISNLHNNKEMYDTTTNYLYLEQITSGITSHQKCKVLETEQQFNSTV